MGHGMLGATQNRYARPCWSCKSSAPNTSPTPFHHHLCLEALEHQSPLVLRLFTGFQVVPGNGRQPRLALLRLCQVQGEYAVLWRQQGKFGACRW